MVFYDFLGLADLSLQIYVVHLHCTSTPEASWVLLGNGVRLAQDVGAHRKIPGQTRPTVQSELWKRAFWGELSISLTLVSTNVMDIKLHQIQG